METLRISALTQGTGAASGMPQTGDAAMDAVRGFAEALSRAESQSEVALTSGTDPHDLVAAIAESRLAVDTIVSLRDKTVEAYQEILRMPI
ncbi:flagellar hook-basal body complex protein FliE [Jannaschia seohaensis]|uniref:Flagellar hook-basal body complex protein FliE n=1 Tax=Jannaschia seohaensis TaxID=475081 RepID=A0A2Y9AXZ2_9RHOB|nr:flagellar hook-basal body complex protein FliE [Jannaschia seohaensis]PWJ16151.1 flagellar hook-basal body complex protein FliE [Jannaschia seohaensis]SSA49140.1 flagellar hook-basal body complex protein FliE [Jannaschia seohaensis]